MRGNNPQEDVKAQDPSASRTTSSQKVGSSRDSNSSHGSGLGKSKPKNR
jgi:hypothetical protein